MSTELFKKLINSTNLLREEVIQTSGAYLANVTKYYLSRTGGEYSMEVFFTHKLVSKAISSNRNFMVRLTMVNSSQTQENYSGIYLKNFEIYSGKQLKAEADKIHGQN